MATQVASVKSNRDRVFEAICDLQDAEQPITRDTIVELTGIKRGIVDEATKTLRELEMIYSPERGTYRRLASHLPARPMSRTILSSGVNKIEVGNHCIELTPRESRMLGALLAGASTESATIETGQAMSSLVAQMGEQFRRLKREVMGG